jgi:SAM-dependent methyltransferase
MDDDLRAQPAAPDRSRSFGGVAEVYDRARPSYPEEAVHWLVLGEWADRSSGADVVEVGAGTGKLTERVLEGGHTVLATDPDHAMLGPLTTRAPQAVVAQAAVEHLPVRTRSVDVVVGAQCFHWFDLPLALPEIARVLRPGGHLALTWNLRDERIPWVRRLGALIGTHDQGSDPTYELLASNLFGFVEKATFRHWQPLDRSRLRELVQSRSNVIAMSDDERESVLRGVDALYEEYGRGADGMLLPYVTHCYKAVVRPHEVAEDPTSPGVLDEGAPSGRGTDPDGDDGALLIDFP